MINIHQRSTDAKRERITTKIVDAVEIAEEQLIARLDSVSTARKDILDQLQADHNNTVSLTTFQQAPNATTQHSGGFDGKKAEALAIESNTIAKLWEEWELIQQKIVCLGIEVLGPDSPIVSSTLDVKNNRIFKKRVERASALYKMHLRNQKKMVATTQKQESYVTGIGVDVMKQLKSQQKVSKDLSHTSRD